MSMLDRFRIWYIVIVVHGHLEVLERVIHAKYRRD